ncbi:MAG: NAD(P)H-hydrate dehydratase [Candidatus Nanohaloarchaea archaeon]|nr:NAD(P)H-hydrate dehydratase [Candidatus Nanohaloarchaea archaeon]
MDWAERLFTDRLEEAKKGDFGTVGFVGGAEEYPNTPAICALASLRTGADLNVIFAPERAADSCAGFAPDLMTTPLDGERLKLDNVDAILDEVDRLSALVVGNGLGDDEATIEAVERLVAETEVPLVLDGDALKADVRGMDLEGRKAVITPHRGEFERLYGEPAEELAAVKEQVEKAARVLGCTVVLKRPVDVVSDGSDVYGVFAGNPYMTKGGTGDALAGICGALLGRTEPITAGYLAAKINGKAGDRVAAESKQSFTIEEMLEEIGPAIEELRQED